MGRSSSQQQQQQQRRSRRIAAARRAADAAPPSAPSAPSAPPAPPAPAAAPSAPPAPPAPLAGEAVWRLLLGELWEPDTALVCSLMATSRALSAVVRQMCVGRVHARLRRLACPHGTSRRAEQRQAALTAQGRAYCRWLVKCADLLASLEVDVRPESDVFVAAALCSGSGPAGARLLGTGGGGGGEEAGEPDAAAADAVATAAAAGATLPPAARLAHLRTLTLHLAHGAARCRHMRLHALVTCSLAACTQLTALEVISGVYSRSVHEALAGALRGHPSLQDLTVNTGSIASGWWSPHFEGGPQLTSMSFRSTAIPERDIDLYAAGLAGLRRLEFPCFSGGVLPASLTHLTLQFLRNVAPLRQLPRLQHLVVQHEFVGRGDRPWGLLDDKNNVSKLTQLRDLDFSFARWDVQPGLLTQVVPLMHAQLTSLRLRDRYRRQGYNASGFEPAFGLFSQAPPAAAALCAAFVAGVRDGQSLRRLELIGLGLGNETNAQLQAIAAERHFEHMRVEF